MSINIKDANSVTIVFSEIKEYMEKLADALHIQYDVVSIANIDMTYEGTLCVMCDFLRTVHEDNYDSYDIWDQKTFDIKFKDGILQSVESYLEDCHKDEYIRACKDKIFFAKKALQRENDKLTNNQNNTKSLLISISTIQSTINDLETKLKKLNEI